MRTPKKEDIERTVKKKGEKGQIRAKKEKEKKRKERKMKQKTTYIRGGRRQSPERTRLLFAGTISPMVCLGDGPLE